MYAPIFCFGHFRLVVRERVLLKDGAPVHLGGRAFDLLLALVERAGETVNSEELFDRIWPNVIVAKGNLRVHVASLRKTLEDGQNGNRFIVNVANQGYCFVAEVSRFQSVVPASRDRFRCRTSAALAIAYTLVTHFDDVLCFVDLADIDDPSQVALAVASALGFDAAPQEPLRTVLACLRDKEILLVLHNGEHVRPGIEQLVEKLLIEAPRVHVVISKRRALRLPLVAHRTAVLRDS